MRLRGERIRTANLEVRHLVAAGPNSRAGLIVPRYSHSAVERNRVKRRLREIVRQHVLPAIRRHDFVVRALPSAYVASFGDLRTECRDACERMERSQAS